MRPWVLLRTLDNLDSLEAVVCIFEISLMITKNQTTCLEGLLCFMRDLPKRFGERKRLFNLLGSRHEDVGSPGFRVCRGCNKI